MRLFSGSVAGFGTVLLVILLTISGPLKVNALFGADFTITSFTADYYLDRSTDGTSVLTVDEIIAAQFTPGSLNHNLSRSLPRQYQGHSVDLQLLNVGDTAGQNYQYTTRDEQGNLAINITAAAKDDSGRQVYEIRYQSHNVTSSYKDHQEFFPNINGYGWSALFSSVSVRVHIPSQLKSAIKGGSCYAGASGKTDVKCTVLRQDSEQGSIIISSAQNLKAGQALRVLLNIQKGTFTDSRGSGNYLMLVAIGIALAIAGLALLRHVLRRGS